MRAIRLLGAAVALVVLGACGNPADVGGAPARGSTSPPTASGVGVATDEPCTRQEPVKAGLAPVGVAPQELTTMVLGSSDLGLTGGQWRWDVWNGGFFGNQELAEMGGLGPDVCPALVRQGRVLGFSSAWRDMGSGSVVASSVHLFLDPAGAAAFVRWLPGQVTEGLDDASFTVQPLTGLGERAVSVRTEGDAEQTWTLASYGNLVASVYTGSQAGSLDVDPVGLLRMQLDRLASTQQTGRPYDSVTVLSAPLPKAAWGDAYADLQWDWFFGGCVDEREHLGRALDPKETRVDDQRFGWIVSCTGMYSTDPQAPQSDGPNRVFTGVTVYPDHDSALAAAAEGLVDAKAGVPGKSEPATTFEVTGVPGAVGTLRSFADGDAKVADTRVTFVVGSVIATVSIRDSSAATDHTTDASAVAKLFQRRLETVLGA